MENRSPEDNLLPNPEFSIGVVSPVASQALIPNYVDAMGLAFDPFAESTECSEDIYLGAGRQELMDQVIYLSEFNAGAVVISGGQGSGKSTLFTGLPARLDESWQSCSIAVNHLNSADEIFSRLASALGVQTTEGASPGEFLVAIRHQLTQGFFAPFILLIDDAHRLEDSILSALISLLQVPGTHEECPFHVVFFADNQLITRLDSFSMVDVLLHDIALERLTLEDTADYLLARLRAAGWAQALPFSDDELAQLLRVSDGNPGRMHQPASHLLADKATLDDERLDTRSGLPVAHMFSLVVLLGVLVMAYFYKDSWLRAPSVAAVQPSINRDSGPSELAELNDTSSALDTSANHGLSSEISTQIVESSAPLERLSTGEKDIPLPTERPEAVAALALDFESAELASAELVAVIPPLTTLPSPAAFGPRPAPANTMTGSSVSETRLSADEQSIMAIEQGRFVLQVMAAGSKVSVERFMSAQVNRSELHMYTTWRRGKPWYVVVAGNYPSSAEARAGVSELPSEQKDAGPWPRPAAAIQTKIKEFRRI